MFFQTILPLVIISSEAINMEAVPAISLNDLTVYEPLHP
jgi:hypothetical protein